MATLIYIAWDADNAGRLIGNARLHDDPEQLARISDTIDKGNALFNSWALEHGGTAISSGGDEGIISVDATALNDLKDIKAKYEGTLELTVSIGIGIKMSYAFKALLASKLRGKNQVTMYDKDVEKEISEANKEEPEKEKLVNEYLHKADETLEKGVMQRVAPFDPAKERDRVTGENKKGLPETINENLNEWMEISHRPSRDKMAGSFSKEMQQRSLHRLHGLTQVRSGPNGREFLLHRGVGLGEARLVSPTHYHNDESSSSWTPNHKVASEFGGDGRYAYNGIRTVSAWVPEQHIKGYIPLLGNIDNPRAKPGKMFTGEKEVIVSPGKFEREHNVAKHEPIHHVGAGGTQQPFSIEEGNPEIQQQETLKDMPEVPEDSSNFEDAFRDLATQDETKEKALKVRHSGDIAKIKEKVAQSLQMVHKQLPVLQQIKQASPDTYEAVLSVVNGLIAIGKQLVSSEQTLNKAISNKKVWVGGGIKIPATGTPERHIWNQNYKQAIANYFTDGRVDKLKEVIVPVSKLQTAHMVPSGSARTRLYHRMVRAGDEMPPMVIKPIRGGKYNISDGNHRHGVAVANNLTHVKALVPVTKGEVNINHNPTLPPAGMTATSTGGFENYDLGMDKSDLMPGGKADNMRPEEFDQEQLAIGTQHELEHTEDFELAREIAMDHLAEDPDYYKEDVSKSNLPMNDKEELDPSKNPPKDNVLDKEALSDHIKSIKAHRKLIPGETLDSRHIVVQNASGKKSVREVSSGMQRDLNENAGNPIGPSMGNPTSTRNKPSRV